MNHFPWKFLLRLILDRGKVDVHIAGLEDLSTKEIFDFPSVSLLREIDLQINNPDLSDHEKVALIQALLEQV